MTAYLPSLTHFRDFVILRRKSDWTGRTLDVPAARSRCVFFSGIAIVGGKLVCTTADLDDALRKGSMTPDDFATASGDFCAVFSDRGKLIIHAGLFGLSCYFLYDNDDLLVISNRIHALVHVLKIENIARKPNRPYIYASLFSTHIFFQQSHSVATYVEGIELIRLDEYVEVIGATALRRKKPAFEDSAAGGSAPRYCSLIDQGVSDILSNVTALVDSDLFDHRKVDLTGGRDSRLLFAAVLQAGALDRTGLVTDRMPGSDDWAVALRIAQLFGAAFFAGDGRVLYSKPAPFVLAAWRSMKAGLNHSMGIPHWTSLGTNARTVRLIGGCGEVYRSFWSRLLSDSLLPECSAALRKVFERIWHPPFAAATVREQAFEDFRSAVSDEAGASPAEKLDTHYMHFRNRMHFGLQGYNTLSDCIMLSPLQSLALLKASRALPHAQRAAGVVLFDALERLVPILNFFENERGARWPEPILRRSGAYAAYRHASLDFEVPRKEAEWHAAQRQRSEAADRNRRELDRLFRSDEFEALVELQCRECLLAIRDSDGEIGAHLGADFVAWVDRLFAQRSAMRLEVASKIMGIFDLWIDSDLRSLVPGSLPEREDYRYGSLADIEVIS